MSNLWYTHTAAETLATCTQKYWYKYGAKLERIPTGEDIDPRLLFGRQFHEAQEEYWGPGGLEAAVEKWDSLLMPWESKVIGRILLVAYAAYYSNDSEYRVEKLQVEEKLRVSLDGIELSGIPDLMAIDAEGKTAIFEHKTTGQDINAAAYWTKVQRSLQGPVYLLLAEKAGLAADYVLWDAVRVPWTKRKLATPLHKREYYVKGDRKGELKPSCTATDESEDSFAQRVYEKVAANPSDFFCRQRLEFSPRTMSHAWDDVEAYARQGAHVLERKFGARHPDGCYKFNRTCEYEPLCYSEGPSSKLYRIRGKDTEKKEEW